MSESVNIFADLPDATLNNRDLVAQGLKDFGATPTAAAALMGDMEQESSFNQRVVGDHGTSFGLLQVGKPLFNEYEKWAADKGLSPKSPGYVYNQAPFIIDRYKSQHPERWDAIQNAPNAPEALKIFRSTPDWGYGIAGKRYHYANAYQDLLSGNPSDYESELKRYQAEYGTPSKDRPLTGEEIRSRIGETTSERALTAGESTTASGEATKAPRANMFSDLPGGIPTRKPITVTSSGNMFQDMPMAQQAPSIPEPTPRPAATPMPDITPDQQAASPPQRASAQAQPNTQVQPQFLPVSMPAQQPLNIPAPALPTEIPPPPENPWNNFLNYFDLQKQAQTPEQRSVGAKVLTGLGMVARGMVPQSLEQAKQMATLPMPSADAANLQKENEQWRQAVTGEQGLEQQVATIGGTALQALPLVGLPFSKSPLRATAADLELVSRLRQPATMPRGEPTRPVLAPEPAERVKIASATVTMDDGRQFDAPTHAQAQDAAEAAGYSLAQIKDNQSFRTSNGDVIAQRPAFGIAKEQNQLKTNVPTSKTIPLLSEYLNKKELAKPAAAEETSVVPQEPRITSTKNAVVDAERVSRGLKPIATEVGRTHPELWAQADSILTENPLAGRQLVADILTGEHKSISPLDEAVLLREKISVQNLRSEAAKRSLDSTSTDAARQTAKEEFDIQEARSTDLDKATRKTGEMWGQFGRFRQRLAADDYSLVALSERLRQAKQGRPLTPEESAKLEAGSKKVADLQTRINQRNARLEEAVARRKGFLPTKEKASPILGDTETEMLQTELAKLKEQQFDMSRLPKAKERTAKRIAEIEGRIERYGFAKEFRREPIGPDKELRDLQYQLYQAKQGLDWGIFQAYLKNRGWPTRAWDTVGDTFSLTKAFRASVDFSAFRRQGGIFTVSHPVEAIKSFAPALKAFKSQKGYFEAMEDIRSRPYSAEYQAGGLAMTDIYSKSISNMEEMYQSRMADKVPLVNHSQRAFTAQLNTMRADWYDIMRKALVGDGPATREQMKGISQAINVWTGRGSLGEWGNASRALNNLFFSARYRWSRFQAITGQPIWGKEGRAGGLSVQKVVAQEYARALIGYGTVLALASTALKMGTGQGISFNPFSSDFGKLKFGNTQVDLLSGLAQATVFTARTARFAVASVLKLPKAKSYGGDFKSVATNFFRGGLAPMPGAIYDQLQGQKFGGEKVTLATQARDLLVPMSPVDIYQSMQEQGIPAGAALGILSILGDGVNTYSPKVTKTPGGFLIMPPPVAAPPPPPAAVIPPPP